MSIDRDSLICPITEEVFHDPVIAEDGRLYERAAITRWINEHGTSPFTRQILDVNRLQPDEEVRKKAEQRRRLSVSYNRESHQIQLPSMQPANNNLPTNRTPNGRQRSRWNNRHIFCDCPRYVRIILEILLCIGVTICLLILIIRIVAVKVTRHRTPTAYPTRDNISIPSNLCYPLNTTLQRNSCLNSSTSITTLISGTCNSFPYQHVQYCFTVSQPIISIFFAFQQTTGYWDLDNIELRLYKGINIFQNGAFDTGSLSPHYTQCQSTGYISSTNSSDNRYYYSDGTQGQFGYLAQSVMVHEYSRYCLSFDLQNRNGTGGTFMIVVGS